MKKMLIILFGATSTFMTFSGYFTPKGRAKCAKIYEFEDKARNLETYRDLAVKHKQDAQKHGISGYTLEHPLSSQECLVQMKKASGHAQEFEEYAKHPRYSACHSEYYDIVEKYKKLAQLYRQEHRFLTVLPHPNPFKYSTNRLATAFSTKVAQSEFLSRVMSYFSK